MHLVFHFFLFDPVANNLVPGQILSLLPLVKIDDKKKLEVAAILDLYRRCAQIEYYIQWMGMNHAT